MNKKKYLIFMIMNILLKQNRQQ